ncbi:hypothetical protein AB205_0220220, partial [Aquarana catesbeiana]
FPFYYELKIAFVAWLLSPYTKGSSLLYRKFVHPTLSSKEKANILLHTYGKVDDVLDHICTFYDTRNIYGFISVLEIDECLIQAKDRSYDALVHFGKRGLNVAASAAVTAAA